MEESTPGSSAKVQASMTTLGRALGQFISAVGGDPALLAHTLLGHAIDNPPKGIPGSEEEAPEGEGPEGGPDEAGEGQAPNPAMLAALIGGGPKGAPAPMGPAPGSMPGQPGPADAAHQDLLSSIKNFKA